jgi:energy-coupling factor transporter transmembrane protein EcfT
MMLMAMAMAMMVVGLFLVLFLLLFVLSLLLFLLLSLLLLVLFLLLLLLLWLLLLLVLFVVGLSFLFPCRGRKSEARQTAMNEIHVMFREDEGGDGGLGRAGGGARSLPLAVLPGPVPVVVPPGHGLAVVPGFPVAVAILMIR